MALEKLLGKITLIGGLSLFGYSCESSSPNTTYCSKDTDCKGDRVCDSSTKTCVDATGSPKQYTCESGSKMVYDRCYKFSGSSNPQKDTERLLKECLEDKDKGSGIWVDKFFKCCYDACSSGYNHDLVNKCESTIWGK
jgi:hypothetical protein